MSWTPAQNHFLKEVARCQKVIEAQSKNIEEICEGIYQSFLNDGVLHVFGSGHSHTIAEELFHRAGGLVPVNAILEDYLMPHKGPSRVGPLERTKGIGEVIFNAHDLRKGEFLILSSNSGINAVCSDMAELAKAKGVKTVAFTSLNHSKQAKARGVKKLYELCDYIVDTGTPHGDACVPLEGLDVQVAPLSTLMNVMIGELMVARICEKYIEAGQIPPVYQSANTEGGEERNQALEEKYRHRIHHLK